MMGEAMMLTFWDVVVECLVEFHHHNYAEAHQIVVELRARLRESDRLVATQGYSVAPGLVIDPSGRISRLNRSSETVRPSVIVYHEEPFYLACDLMNHQLNLEGHREKYDTILQRHGW
jgi:hypothetical protein